MENYKITKDQVLELAKKDVNQYQLKEWFPEVFKTELEVSKWYKRQDEYCDWLMNYQGKEISCYGFNTSKNYSEHYTMNDDGGKWIEATPEEVKEALINEAKKRGYKKYVKCVFGKAEEKRRLETDDFKLSTDNELCVKRFNSTTSDIIFKKGKWAEIITEETKEITIDKAVKILSEKYGKKVTIK